MTFSEFDKLKALAIVNTFETSQPFGDYAACTVLNDSAGISYGICQFTHRSGSLAAVVESYLNSGGQVCRNILSEKFPLIKRHDRFAIRRAAADAGLKKALAAAAVTREMKAAQNEVAAKRYLHPAVAICEKRGFVLPLSLAVIYDSVTHGSWQLIADKTERSRMSGDERGWITAYVRRRHLWLGNIARLKATTYRTRFFLNQIALANWKLRLPVNVHGVRLSDEMLPQPNEPVSAASSAEQNDQHSKRDLLESAHEIFSKGAEKFDRVDGIITGVATRKDAAKSLWTTIIGTIWQATWAVFGFLTGLPREVWIVVALIAGALMIIYLYRQIVLGKIREKLTTDNGPLTTD